MPNTPPLLPIDDREAETPAPWRYFTDAVMGGLSSGSMAEHTVQGRRALCLRGQVRLDNQGGFIQMVLDGLALPAGTPPWQGLMLDVCGNGLRYGLHLRTRGMTAPWQAFRASFEAPPLWTTVALPFDAFAPYRTSGRLQPEAVQRLGVLAIGAAMTAEVCVARVALYR